MKGPLISLSVVLAVLAGCPETPTETVADVAQAREYAVSADAAPEKDPLTN